MIGMMADSCDSERLRGGLRLRQKDDSERLSGFDFRWTDRRTDICGCRVALATETNKYSNLIILWLSITSIDTRTISNVGRSKLLEIHVKLLDPDPGLPDRLHILVEAFLASISAVTRLLVASKPSRCIKHVVAVDPNCSCL